MNSPVFYTHGFLVNYVAAWSSFCLLALVLGVIKRKSLAAELPDYVRFLTVRWKILSFLPAFAFVAFAGPLTNDPTWDVITGGGMAVLTFTTAPWVVGTVFNILRGHGGVSELVIALALWLFSSSWFYDAYLFLRDGHYTDYWLGNLLISPFIYLAAGLLWNLEAKPSGGFRLSFLRADWPKPPGDRRFAPLFLVSVPIVVVAVYLLAAFVDWPALASVAEALGLK